MSKKLRYVLFIAYIVLCGVMMAGFIVSDYAKKEFWWTFWDISKWVGVVAFIYGMFGLPNILLPKSSK